MPDECRYSLIDDALFRIQSLDGKRSEISLPQVFAGLVGDQIVSFEALQSHQRQAWYCFLVQLAAIALANSNQQKPLSTASRWRELLLALTDGDELPWCLVVEDISRAAFMQSPVAEESLREAGYKTVVSTPDHLDILVTSKNHDVKMHRIAHPQIEHWIYALVTLQTMEGFLGQGNYGIVRMNGGFGNRPMVGITSHLNWGPRFRRDVGILVSARPRLAEQYNYDLKGIALLWLLPWNGSKSDGIRLARCSPLFIEICRRIRFTCANGSLYCRTKSTKATRIAGAKQFQGVTGDPWTPIEKEKSKALTLGERGFSYHILHRILFTGEYTEPLALETTAAERDGAFVTATTLVRGEGKTDGWHDRIVPIPSKAIHLLESTSKRKDLAVRAQEQVDTASIIQRRLLYPALCVLLAAGSNEKVTPGRLNRWLNAYDSAVDDVFFQRLWDSLDVSRNEARLLWQQQLFNFALQQLEKAIRSTPLPSIRRYRAISAAESIFHGSAHRLLDKLFPKREEKEEHDHLAGL